MVCLGTFIPTARTSNGYCLSVHFFIPITNKRIVNSVENLKPESSTELHIQRNAKQKISVTIYGNSEIRKISLSPKKKIINNSKPRC